MNESRDKSIVEAGPALLLDGRVKCLRGKTRGREMKVKIIPIILLLFFSMAAPVVVSMAVPKKAEVFHVVAVLDPLVEELLPKRGVQKYIQPGVLYDKYEGTDIGDIELHIIITNFVEAFTGKYARAMVHFIMDFDDGTIIRGTITGKIWFHEDMVQHVDGIFVGRGSHVKGTVHMIDIPDVLVFDGMEWQKDE